MSSEGLTNNVEKARNASAGLMSGNRLRYRIFLGLTAVAIVAALVGVVGVGALMLGAHHVASAVAYPVAYTFIGATAAGAVTALVG